MSGEAQSGLKGKLDGLSKNLENPFIHVRNWVKGEMLNLNSLIAAIADKESCEVRK